MSSLLSLGMFAIEKCMGPVSIEISALALEGLDVVLVVVPLLSSTEWVFLFHVHILGDRLNLVRSKQMGEKNLSYAQRVVTLLRQADCDPYWQPYPQMSAPCLLHSSATFETSVNHHL